MEFINYLAQLLMSLPPGEWVNNTSRVQGLIKSLVRVRVSVQLCFLPHRRQYARLTLEGATIAEQEDFQVGASWRPCAMALTSIPSQQWRLGRVTCLSVPPHLYAALVDLVARARYVEAVRLS